MRIGMHSIKNAMCAACDSKGCNQGKCAARHIERRPRLFVSGSAVEVLNVNC